jgi:hypothetical protein
MMKNQKTVISAFLITKSINQLLFLLYFKSHNSIKQTITNLGL